MSRNQVRAGDVAQGLTEPYPLFCNCGRRLLAMFEPPNKVVIKTRVHGEWHSLSVVITMPSLAELLELHPLPKV